MLTEVIIEYEKDGPKQLRIGGIDANFEGRSARIFTDRTLNEIFVDEGRSYEVSTRPAEAFEGV